MLNKTFQIFLPPPSASAPVRHQHDTVYVHTPDHYTNTQYYCTHNMYLSEHHLQVTLPESMIPRLFHSITATSLGPGLTEVLMFGGIQRSGGNPIAETTILRFGKEYTSFAKFTPHLPPTELIRSSASVAGPSAGKWTLVDVAHNDTRGTTQRLSEKRIRQATARASSVSETSNHSSQDRVRALEQASARASSVSETSNHSSQDQVRALEQATAHASSVSETSNHSSQDRVRALEQQLRAAEQREYATQLLLQVKYRELAIKDRELANLDSQETLPGRNTKSFVVLLSIQLSVYGFLSIRPHKLNHLFLRPARFVFLAPLGSFYLTVATLYGKDRLIMIIT